MEGLVGEGIEFHHSFHAAAHQRKVVLGYVYHGFYRRANLTHAQNGQIAAHIARVVVACGYHTADRRCENGVFACVLILGSGGIELCFGLLDRHLGAAANTQQFGGAVIVTFNLVELNFQLVDICGIEFHQGLSSSHGVAYIYQYPADTVGCGRCDVVEVLGFDVGGVCFAQRNLAYGYHIGFHQWQFFFFGGGGGRFFLRAAA